MFGEILKSVRFQIYERASSPLLGTFALSWIGWNYKFVMVLLSSANTHDKFEYIESTLYADAITPYFMLLIYPLITTVFLLFIVPEPSRWFYETWQNNQKKLIEIKQRIEDETPLTQAQYKKIRLEMRESSIKQEDEIRKRDNEIEELKELLLQYSMEKSGLERTLSQENKDNASKLPELESDESNLSGDMQKSKEGKLGAEQEKMLRVIGELSSPSIEEIMQIVRENSTKSQYLIDQLKDLDMVEAIPGAGRFRTTKDGRAYLIENKII